MNERNQLLTLVIGIFVLAGMMTVVNSAMSNQQSMSQAVANRYYHLAGANYEQVSVSTNVGIFSDKICYEHYVLRHELLYIQCTTSPPYEAICYVSGVVLVSLVLILVYVVLKSSAKSKKAKSTVGLPAPHNGPVRSSAGLRSSAKPRKFSDDLRSCEM